jgi:hypothetical protein
MLSLGGSLAFMLVALLFGRGTKNVRYTSYVALILIALAQVLIILFDMYTKKPPTVE